MISPIAKGMKKKREKKEREERGRERKVSWPIPVFSAVYQFSTYPHHRNDSWYVRISSRLVLSHQFSLPDI